MFFKASIGENQKLSQSTTNRENYLSWFQFPKFVTDKKISRDFSILKQISLENLFFFSSIAATLSFSITRYEKKKILKTPIYYNIKTSFLFFQDFLVFVTDPTFKEKDGAFTFGIMSSATFRSFFHLI